jgi:methyl-accepting chemotaxis protein
VTSAANSLELIAKTAEGHATAAEEVNASTQQQSAACEQMTSASNVLLSGSTQLRELVGGLRTMPMATSEFRAEESRLFAKAS